MEIIEKLATKNGLVFAFLVVGARLFDIVILNENEDLRRAAARPEPDETTYRGRCAMGSQIRSQARCRNATPAN